MKKKFLLGLVAMLLPLTTWAQQQTFVVTLDEATIEYNGTATAPTVTVKASSDGEALTLNSDYFVYYTKAGTSASLTNVGEYIVNVQGQGNYAGWSATTTLTVTPKIVKTLSLKAFSKEYGTKDEDLNLVEADFITVPDDALGTGDQAKALIDCLKLRRVNTTEEGIEDAGSYLVTVENNTNPNNNYSYEPESSTNVTMTITKKELTVTWTDQTYNGQEINLTAFNPTLRNAVSEDNITVSFEKNNDKDVIKDAGDYIVKVKLDGSDDKLKNYTLKNATETVKVRRADLTILARTSGVFKKNFGDKDPANLTEQFEFNTWLDTTHETVTMVRTEGEDAGDYDITYQIVDGKDTVTILKNYEIKYDGTKQKFTIDPKYLTGTDISVTVNQKALVYQGVNFVIPDTLFTVKYREDTLTLNKDYTVTMVKAETAARNAGDKFSVKITAVTPGNYAGELAPNGQSSVSDNITAITDLTITKAPLTIEANSESLTKVYDGEDVSEEDLQAAFTIEGIVGEDEQENVLKMVKNGGANAMAYWVNVHKVTEDGTVNIPQTEYKSTEIAEGLANYTINGFDNRCQYKITKKPLTYSIADTTKVYNGKSATPTFTIVSDDVVDADRDDQGNIVLDKVFTTKPTIKVKEGTALNVGVYNLQVSNLAKVASDNYEITEDSYVEGESTYEITKAPLTIKVLDQTVEYSEKGDVNFNIVAGYNITKAEAEEAHTVHISTTFTTADQTAINELLKDFEITYADGYSAQMVGAWENALILDAEIDELVLQNFEVKDVQPGTLTVNGDPTITLDRDGADTRKTGPSVETLLKAYNGVKEMTVVLGGDRDIKADYWYTWVLPFETTVREISNAFGYAVVNVPDQGNTDKGVVAFKLKVDAQTIPANTLILIKTDQATNLKDGKVKFEDKTIEYDPKYVVTDGAGNEYQGVYTTEELKEDGYWYLSSGKFWNAGAYYRQYGKPVTVNPLGGYVYAVAGAAARIIVEEADGSTTAINAITGESVNYAAEGWYTIDGVKLNTLPTQKGVYINNGKKVVIK